MLKEHKEVMEKVFGMMEKMTERIILLENLTHGHTNKN